MSVQGVEACLIALYSCVTITLNASIFIVSSIQSQLQLFSFVASTSVAFHCSSSQSSINFAFSIETC